MGVASGRAHVDDVRDGDGDHRTHPEDFVSCRVEIVVRLLGVARRRLATGEMALPPGRATQLAAVLALRNDWVGRAELVDLLWPDTETDRARRNLSQLLYEIRRTPWGNDVEGETTRVRWSVSTDVAAFRGAAAEGAWSLAISLYDGDLLADVGPSPSEPFDEWLRVEREDLRETWHDALRGHADALGEAGRWRERALVLRRLVASDGLLEDAVQALMRDEARAGRRDVALQVFGSFRERLARELGLAPLDATNELAEAVRAGRFEADIPEASEDPASDPAEGAPPPPSVPGAIDVRPGPVRNLGADATPFVGRALELAELHTLLGGGSHRLVTIHGTGGSGKSRLARQLARERAGHHEDGAAWVPLAAARDESGVIDAIVRALSLRVPPELDALSEALSGGERLLVLDEAEHLPDVPGVVSVLLDACPGLRLVVTSRAVLDVPGEAVVPVAGLNVPPSDDDVDAEAYDAVGLLLRAAHRVRPGFQPRDEERVAAVALTRVLAGSPLAIELAAGWLRLLSPSELLEQVQGDLDVLRATHGDVPERHTSLRAVFESSWSLLSETERAGLRRLAVFVDGCTRESAVAVADVPLHVLLALTNRALLQRRGRTRFVPHPMVQHFLRDKLAEEPTLQHELEGRHGAYFLALADDADERLDTPDQPQALQRLEDDAGNLVAALERAVAAGEEDVAHAMCAALGRFWRWRGRVREAAAWFERARAIRSNDAPSALRVRFDLAEGLLLERLGAYDRAETMFEGGLADARRLGEPGLEAAALNDQAMVAWRRGDLARARALFADVRDRNRQRGHDASLAGSLGNLGNVERDMGDLDAAHVSYDEALVLAERLGHLWEVANVLNNKAIAYAYARDLEAARVEFERALALQRSIENAHGVSTSLINLGNVHLDTDQPERAEALYREALALCEELGNRDGMAHLHVNLGILAQRRGEHGEAHALYGAALRLRRELGARALVAQSVSCLLDLAVARGDHERALVLAGAVRSLCASVGVPLTPPQQSVYDDALLLARASVPAERATELERRGEALSEREAVSYALAERVSGSLG